MRKKQPKNFKRKTPKKDKPLSYYRLKAIYTFNKWIRNRDKENGCISCGGEIHDAGHYYSAGHYNQLRFNEDNVNGQCKKCNLFLRGNLILYTVNLEKKIGKERIDKLHFLASIKKPVKYNKFFYMEIIEKYKL